MSLQNLYSNNFKRGRDYTMLIATSLMYSTNEYEIKKQKMAMNTWKHIGFQVVSCNVKEEIEILQPLFPQTAFVQLKRSGKEITGKPYPFIYDILQVLTERTTPNELCGIINSDIFLKGLSVQDIAKIVNENNMCILHRYDVENEQDIGGEYFFSGIDTFFFLNTFLPKIQDKGFMLGRPEWDHWFLLEMQKAGVKVREIRNKMAFHIKHEQRWSAADSNKMVLEQKKNKEKLHKKTVLESEYYEYSNEIMADLSAQIVITPYGIKEYNRLERKSNIWDQDRDVLLQWEEQAYGSSYESEGLFYWKNGKPCRICALHRQVSVNTDQVAHLGDFFTNDRNKGCITRYIDFKTLDFFHDLKRLYIYPAGRAARLLLDCLDAYNVPVLGLVDRDVSLWNTMCQGHNIFSLDALKDDSSYDYVLIATNMYVKEIYSSLKNIVDERKLIVL